ncbi:SDR family oxidoreductase [Calditrichota bacterium LG25]
MKPPIDSWILITGATKGIGLAITRRLAAAGWNLILIARSESRLSELSHQIHVTGGKVQWFKADLTCAHDLNQLGDWIKSKQMKLKAAVLNAGIAKTGRALEMPLNDWRQLMETNLLAPVALLQVLKEFFTDYGQIIFINSVAGKTVFPEWGAYAASKFALRALAETLRLELAPQKIRVTSVFPASVNTPLHDRLELNWDRQNMLQPDDVARGVEWALNAPQQVNLNEISLENVNGLF